MILTVEYVSGILLMIQGYFQGQKVNLKVTFVQIQVGTSAIHLFDVNLNWRVRLFRLENSFLILF